MTAQVETVYRGYCEHCNVQGPAMVERQDAQQWRQDHDKSRHPGEPNTSPPVSPPVVSDEAVNAAHEVLMNSQLRIKFEGATTREVTRDALETAAAHLTHPHEVGIRADEREKAAARIEAMPVRGPGNRFLPAVSMRTKAAAIARANNRAEVS